MLFLIGHYAFIFAVDTFISSYLIWLYCNKLVLRYVRLRVSDPGQVSIPQPGIVTVNNKYRCEDLDTINFRPFGTS